MTVPVLFILGIVDLKIFYAMAINTTKIESHRGFLTGYEQMKTSNPALHSGIASCKSPFHFAAYFGHADFSKFPRILYDLANNVISVFLLFWFPFQLCWFSQCKV